MGIDLATDEILSAEDARSWLGERLGTAVPGMV